MLTVYNVNFKSLSEYCRALGYSKPVGNYNIKKTYGGSVERLADIRLKLDGLSAQEKQARVQAALDKLRSQPKAGRPPAAYSVMALQAALRLAIAHIAEADLTAACTISGGRLTAAQLKAGLDRYAENLDLADAYKELAKY